jgi:hypothetical protein
MTEERRESAVVDLAPGGQAGQATYKDRSSGAFGRCSRSSSAAG